MKFKIKKASPQALALYSKKQKKKFDPIFFFGIALCFAVLIGCVAYFVSAGLSYSHAEYLYNGIEDRFTVIDRLPFMAKPKDEPYLLDYDTMLSSGSSFAGGSQVESIELIRIKSTLRALRRVNEDVVGWITVEDTGIDYPIVRTTDNDFYLDHAYDRSYLNAGAIFFDFRCTDSLDNTYNTVIYGHNMFSGIMFHDVIKYKDEEFFASHDITISTDDGIFVYRPFSIYETVSTDIYFEVNFDSDDEFGAFLNSMGSRSIFDTDVELDGSDRIITFSTCTNDSEEGRLVLHAVLTEKRK